MKKQINALGAACPLPVLMAKKALDEGAAAVSIAVDNTVAVENLRRLGLGRGLSMRCIEQGGTFIVHLGEDDQAHAASPVVPAAPPLLDYAVFISRACVGEGDPVLGASLMKMLLYTLSQSGSPPASLLFMNGGVRVPAGDETGNIESLQELLLKGCEILVCGACLNYYGLSDALKVGSVSNMYEIMERMQQSAKVITI